MAGIQNFLKNGKSISGYRPITGGVRSGVRDPETGKLWVHPRQKLDGGLKAGGSVKIVNPRAMTSRVARRHGTIGGGLVGDRSY